MTAPFDLLQDVDPESIDSRDEALEPLLGDVAAAGATAGPQREGPDPAAPIPGGGFLLEADARAVFKEVHEAVQRQERLAKNRNESGKHYGRLADGASFSYLEKSEDRSVWKAVLPPGMDEDAVQPIPNKIADLRKKIVSQVLVDRPMPNPKADGDSDQARGAADLARKWLRADALASGTDDDSLSREALNLNMTWGSAFAWAWVDPTGGGWRPMQKWADPQAVDPDFPFAGPEGVRTGDPVLRYVTEREPDPMNPGVMKRQFTEDPAAAERMWLPKVCRQLLGPNQVRTVPATATVFDAEKVVLLLWEPLSKARRRFPQLADMPDAQLQQLCAWRPKRWKDIVPAAHRSKGAETEGGKITDDTLIFWYHVFCRIAPDYPDGGEVAVNGASEGTMLVRDTLRDDVETDDGTLVPVLREPPVTQFVAQLDTEGQDPMGLAGIRDFAGGNELMANLLVSILEAIDKGLNPIPFIPGTSPVTREDMQLARRDGTPVEVLTKDDMPTWEQPPSLPSFTFNVLEYIEGLLNSAAGTNETSNGLDSPYAVSGEAKKVAIRQAKVVLAQYWSNYIRGLSHWWRIKLQLAQGRLTVPQIVKLTGEEEAYKQRWWVGADLIGVTDIPLQPGTGTMMAGPEKANWLRVLQDSGWLDPIEAGEIARGSMTDDLGLQKSAHEERIDRAIADWLEGPPKGWLEGHRQNQMALQQRATMVQQMTAAAGATMGVPPEQIAAQVEQQVPPPQLVPLFNPFEPRPNDEEPAVAKVHYGKLSRIISTPDYTKHPKEWRTLLDTAYATACYAAGIVTVRQQFEVAQQQQQAQAQAEADATAREQQDKEKDRATKGEESEKQRQFQSQEAQRDRAAAASTAAAGDQRRAQLQTTLADRTAARASAPGVR